MSGEVTDERVREVLQHYNTDGFEFSKESGSREVSGLSMVRWIEDGKRYFKEFPGQKFYFSQSGDSFLFMDNTDDEEIQIRICTRQVEFSLPSDKKSAPNSPNG
jgi:hypothetical protein